MIKLQNVEKVYKSENGNVTALNDINLEFESSGMVFVVGRSGSGKTTLLNIIGSLDHIDNGEVSVTFPNEDEYNLSAASEKELDEYRNLHVGFVFQEYNLLKDWSIRDNILLPVRQQYTEGAEQEEEKILEQVLHETDLNIKPERKANELSGGQAQRVAIARAIVKNPEIILADEPTGNLDDKTSIKIIEILKRISKTKLVIMVTHDESMAQVYADRIIRVADGVIVSDEYINDNEYEVGVYATDEPETPAHKFHGRLAGVMLSIEKIFLQVTGKRTYNVCVEHIGHEREEEPNICEYQQKSVKPLNRKMVLKTAFMNLKKRKARLAITTAVFMVTIFVLLFVSEVIVSMPGKAIDECIGERGIEEIYLKSIVEYKNAYRQADFAQSGNNDFVKENVATVWKDFDIERYASGLALVSDNNDVDFFTGKGLGEAEIIFGREPVAEDEICITDYMADQMDLTQDSVGMAVYCYGAKLKITGIVGTDYKQKDIVKKIRYSKLTNDEIYDIQHVYERAYCTDGLWNYLSKNATYMRLKSADLFQRGEQAYLEGEIAAASVRDVTADELIYGRRPEAANEIVVSKDLLDRGYVSLEDDNMTTFTAYDLGAEKYNGAYTGMLNLHNYSDSFKVVGIADKKDVQMYMYDETYDVIRNDFFTDCILDVYGIKTNGKQISKYVDSSYRDGVYVDHPLADAVVSVYQVRSSLEKYGVLIIIVFAMLSILLNLAFISYSIYDNHKNIGVLRAMGVRRKDIIAIFMAEAIVMALASYVIANALMFVLIGKVNQSLSSAENGYIAYFHRSTVMALVIFIIAIVMTVASAIGPVIAMSRKKPVSLIRS